MTKRFAFLPLVALLGACAPSTNADTIDVVTTAYPLTFVAERIGGDAINLIDVTTGDAHDIELSSRQVAQIEAAPVVLYFGDHFQPAVEQAVGEQGVDGLDSVENRRDGDPHVWLDPLNLAAIGDDLAATLSELEPDQAEYFARNAAQLRADLELLDSEFTASLGSCTTDTIVTSHEAFGYLTDAYELQQVGILGVNPDAEPSPARLREMATYLETHNIDTVFFESNDASAEQLAKALNVEARNLWTLEVAPPTGDYLEAMRENLAVLQTGLGC